LTEPLTNTCHALLVALFAHYQQKNWFAPLPLRQVQIAIRQRNFAPADKPEQILLSILAGCTTLSEVNPYPRQEQVLAATLGISRPADQSSLSRTLDALTLKNIEELRTISTLALPSKGHYLRLYDAQGGAEVEQFRNDKSGLNLEARRKRNFTGQQGYILLTDLAHNLLADFAPVG
jgi:hypothetical protein